MQEIEEKTLLKSKNHRLIYRRTGNNVEVFVQTKGVWRELFQTDLLGSYLMQFYVEDLQEIIASKIKYDSKTNTFTLDNTDCFPVTTNLTKDSAVRLLLLSDVWYILNRNDYKILRYRYFYTKLVKNKEAIFPLNKMRAIPFLADVIFDRLYEVLKGHFESCLDQIAKGTNV